MNIFIQTNILDTNPTDKKDQIYSSNNLEDKKTSKANHVLILDDNQDVSSIINNFLNKPKLGKPNVISAADMSNAVMKLQMKLVDTILSSSLEDVNISKIIIKNNNKHIMEKLNEQITKQEQADKENQASNILSWVGTIFALLFSVMMTIVTGGGCSGLLVGAIIGLTIQILDSTGVTEKIVQHLAQKLEKTMIAKGINKEEAKLKAQMIAAAVVGTIMICITIVGVNSISSSKTLSMIKFKKLFTKLMPNVGKLMQNTSTIKNMDRASHYAIQGGLLAQAGTHISQAGLEISSSVKRKEHELIKAERMDLLQAQKMTELFLQENIEFIKKISEFQQNIITEALSLIKNNQSTAKNIIQHV